MGASATQYLTPKGTGEIGVGATEVQGPDIECKMAMIVADPGNSGVVYVGLKTGVTVTDGTTDITSGIPRSAGQDTGWLFVGNLNELFFIASGAGQSVAYIYQS